MNMVHDLLLEKLIDYLDSIIYKGKVKINGEYKDYTIFKTSVEGNRLRKYLYLESEVGLIEEAQLLTSFNEILAKKPFSIDKTDDGLVLVFDFTLSVKEGKNVLQKNRLGK